MPLTQSQKVLVTKARAAGSSELAVTLDDGACAYLAVRIANDLNLQQNLANIIPAGQVDEFFDNPSPSSLSLDNVDYLKVLEHMFSLYPDADTYFSCLATLHKARLKYERILQSQAMPTIDQVGPRGLLQYGTISPVGLLGLLYWRKWIFDIDNRAGQETGYLFEPILAHSIGGTPFSAKKSPIKRRLDPSSGRQVDCVLDLQKRAYEFKLRVTNAASGQGRWGEELSFPEDCQSSGYTPVLVVLDPTPNPKLQELELKFQTHGGEAYLGDDAWQHLESAAGNTMSMFLEKYVREPLKQLLDSPTEDLPNIGLSTDSKTLTITIGGETLIISRDSESKIPSDTAELPPDIEDGLPG